MELDQSHICKLQIKLNVEKIRKEYFEYFGGQLLMETFWWKSGGKYSVENLWGKMFGRMGVVELTGGGADF